MRVLAGMLAALALGLAGGGLSQAQAPKVGEAKLSQSLQAYAAFQSDVAILSAAELKSAADVETALDRAASANSEQLAQGWIAYAAITASQSPAFVETLRDLVKHYGVARVAKGLMVDPGYAGRLPGGDQALALAIAAAEADGGRIEAVAEQYRQRALSSGREAWAKPVISGEARQRLLRLESLLKTTDPRPLAPEAASRLTVSALATTPGLDPNVFGGGLFWQGLYPIQVAPIPVRAMVANSTQRTGVESILSLAGLIAIGALDEAGPEQIDRLLAHNHTKACFERAQLQLLNCVSSAHTHLDNVACIGAAGLEARARCVRDFASPAPAVAAAP